VSFREDIAALVAANSFGALAAGKDWPRVKLGDVARVINGFAFESKFFRHDVGTPLVRIRDVVGGSSDTRYAGPLPKGYEVADGDLLVGMDGDFNSAFWRGGPALLNQRVCRLVPDVSRLRLRFLAYLLPAYLKLINDYTSSVTVKHLSSKTLQDLPIPLPSVSVQDALVARIEELFAEVDEGESAVDESQTALVSYRKALLKAATTGALIGSPAQRKVALEGLPSLPASWSWTRLGDIGVVSGGLTKNSKRDLLPTRVPYLRVANVQAGRLDLRQVETIGVTEGELGRVALRLGDLLIVEGNGSVEQIGRSALWDGSIEVCAHQNHLIRVRFSRTFLADWIQSWLQSPHGRRELEAQASSTSGLHTLSISKVSGLRCPLPPPDELEQSMGQLSAFRAQMQEAEVQLAELAGAPAKLRQSILAAAFRGDLVA
jgi:type I restriction enzyme S subunit